MKLKGKAIVIIGATGGMGEDLCKALAAGGAKLALASTNETKLNSLVGILKEKYDAEIWGSVLNVTKEDEVKVYMEQAAARFGKIYALINLAGLSVPGKILETEETVYDTLMDVNVKGIFLTSKYFSRYADESAQIINIGSMAARRVNANAPLYCVAKTAVNTLSQGLALQLKERNIRVTTLNPGGVDTPFWGERKVDREKLMTVQDITPVILFVLQIGERVAINSIDFESISMI